MLVNHEVVWLKLSRKLTYVRLKLKCNGKRLYLTNPVEYLAVSINGNLNCEQYSNSRMAIKLNKANDILSKLRNFIVRKTLKPIYHAIFEPQLYYTSIVCP